MPLANLMGEEKFRCYGSEDEISANWINANCRLWRAELSIITRIKPRTSNTFVPFRRVVSVPRNHFDISLPRASLLRRLRIVCDYLVTQTRTFARTGCYFVFDNTNPDVLARLPTRLTRVLQLRGLQTTLSYRVRFALGSPHFACTATNLISTLRISLPDIRSVDKTCV